MLASITKQSMWYSCDTAGKLQRKFLLLAAPGGELAGVLVESHRYAYVYR